MNNNSWFKKENPFQTVIGYGGGATGFGAYSSGASKTYVDDVFSTFLWAGNSSDRSITNDIDLSGKGGLTWIKDRSAGEDHWLFSTSRGADWGVRSHLGNAEVNTGASYLSSFNSNGFSIGTHASINASGDDYTSWSFRKAPGFFDTVTWTGDGSDPRNISHSLESIPGCMMFKRLDSSGDWVVYHRSLTNPATYLLQLDSTGIEYGTHGDFGSTLPTSSVFTVASNLNTSGATYVAYLFAGGASDAATARSVHFDGSSGYLNTTSSSSDLTMGTGDFTIECWVSKDAQTHKGIWQISSTSGGMASSSYGDTLALGYQNGVWQIYGGGTYKNSWGYDITVNQWYHTAYVRSSGVSTLYVNGNPVITQSDTNDYDGTYMVIGGYYNTSYLHNGKISNFRVIKGQALYTSSFHPPTEPLTNVTNTKVLCCNNASSVTGATITPATLQSNGSMTVQTSNPFDDIEAYKFGPDSDNLKEIIKCGSYVGNGSATGPVIDLAWEPQWILIKSRDASADWYMLDSMRGIVSGDDDKILEANTAGAESANGWNLGKNLSIGFQLEQSGSSVNGNGDTYVYIAIRRPDGYVGKPASAGTDVFAMDTGTGSGTATIPDFDTTFPVDFALSKNPTSTGDWYTSGRLIQTKYLLTQTSGAQASGSWAVFDSNLGWGTGFGSSMYSWMWKRGAGFDVVAYEGDQGDNRIVQHSLGVVPEMIWVKNRTSSNPRDWVVYHKGLNGGTNPENYYLKLNAESAEASTQYIWSEYAPTAIDFQVDSTGVVNDTGDSYLSMLFSSVESISKVGYYTGTGSATTITTGFQPRWLLVKNADTTNAWNMVDTLRGWAAGNDERLWPNTNDAQSNSADMGEPTSTGFTLADGDARWNASGNNYIYYAHA